MIYWNKWIYTTTFLSKQKWILILTKTTEYSSIFKKRKSEINCTDELNSYNVKITELHNYL